MSNIEFKLINPDRIHFLKKAFFYNLRTIRDIELKLSSC